ncbi:MAG: hypothetical protein ABFS41_14970 [Myxococcota bacterium]
MRLHPALLAALLLTAPAALAAKGGTNVLHLSLRSALVATDADPDAAGRLDVKLRQQGKADVQKLTFEVSGLEPDSTYHLFLLHRGEMDAMEVASFMTDADGEASLKLKHLGHKNQANKKFPGPGFDPLTDVLALEVRDGGDGVVLEADLTMPDKLSYLVKRRLDNEGVDADAEGTLFMKDKGTSARFRLKVANLDLVPSADYTLAINCDDVSILDCEYVETFTADEGGKLDVKELPGTPPAPFHMTDVPLVDGNGDVVLSTTLP